MNNEAKLALLRIQLFTAAQELKGADAVEFWKLLDEVQAVRVVSDGSRVLGDTRAAARSIKALEPTIRPPLPPRSESPPPPPPQLRRPVLRYEARELGGYWCVHLGGESVLGAWTDKAIADDIAYALTDAHRNRTLDPRFPAEPS